MGISQKVRAAMKLLKEIAHEYSIMTRKNKCIPGTRKKGASKKGTGTKKSKTVRFNKPLSEPEPIEEPVEEPVKEPVEEPVKEPVEEPVEQVNPFEQSAEEGPIEEPEREPNLLDDGLTQQKE
jgi:hypothetical protein